MTVRYRRSSHALTRRVGPNLLVATPGDPDVHELSGGAEAVWVNLDAPVTAHDLIERLAAAHAVPREQIQQSVLECLENLRSLGAVEESGEHDR